MTQPQARQTFQEEVDFDESEFFGDEPAAGPAETAPPQPGGTAASDSDKGLSDDDGLVISDCSSDSDAEDAVEEHLRLRLQSLQSSLDKTSQMEAELATSHGSHHGSQVGSLKTFGSSGPLHRGFGSDGDLATATASMPVTSAFAIHHPRARRASSGAASECKLGTSMPIGIPLMQRRPLAASEGFDNDDEFVPPHLVEQDTGDMWQMFRSLSGLSPNSTLKRDRLAQRNYIMRATGFLETGGAPPAGAAADPLQGGMGASMAIPARPPRVPTQTSSLSAALGLGTTPQ